MLKAWTCTFSRKKKYVENVENTEDSTEIL